jgi:hypothetical protein
MKAKFLPLFAMLFLSDGSGQAAVRTFEVKSRVPVHEDRRHYETVKHNYGFRVEIISDEDGVKAESLREGRPLVTARKGERYSIRLYNPLPVRVAVNLSVDGLNSITGKPSGIADGTKWIIDANSFITIRGWQVGADQARRFFFTDKPASYAAWRGEKVGKDLAANCGVIGAAYFWSRKELESYYDQYPIYRPSTRYSQSQARGAAEDAAKPSPSAPAEAQRAGTGMGEREAHPTIQVDFRYDAGMYRVSDAVLIYYDFERNRRPDPFPDLSFAPEMPENGR